MGTSSITIFNINIYNKRILEKWIRLLKTAFHNAIMTLIINFERQLFKWIFYKIVRIAKSQPISFMLNILSEEKKYMFYLQAAFLNYAVFPLILWEK